MMFPNVEEIATKDVITIGAEARVRDALRCMSVNKLRDIVVVGEPGADYGILTASDAIQASGGEDGLDALICNVPHRKLVLVPSGRSVLEIFDVFSQEVGHVGVVDSDGALRGILSSTDIMAHIDPQTVIERQRIGQLLVKHAVKTAASGSTLGSVIDQLRDSCDAIVVVRGHEPQGILTTKDAVRVLYEGLSLAAPVDLHMSRPLETVSPDLTIKQAVSYLQAKHFKRLVVRAPNGELLGIVTQQDLITIAFGKWADLLRHHATELRGLVDVLTRKTERLQNIATTDSLTGAFNRTHFDEVLARELERFRRYPQSPFSALLLDLDHFKAVNDAFGHLEGDRVLQQVARIAQQTIRSTDLFARWGGEEFVVLLPQTLLKDARELAERLRARIGATPVGTVGCVTVSIGVAECRKSDTAEALFRGIDRALYRAKSAGRNRVEVSSAQDTQADLQAAGT